jgi:hypothetical protein
LKRKFIGIGAMLAIVCSLLVSGIAFADDPTTVDVTWSGVGAVTGSVDTGDATANFGSAGNGNIGEFHAVDSNDNPYSYTVDSNSFSLDTTITGGGVAYLDVKRLTSKTSMYGPAGQESYIYVATDSGTATLQNRSSTNYAAMKDSNYGWNANDHITVANATNYILERFMDGDSSDGDWSGGADFAGLYAFGTGSADLDCMSSEASGSQVRLGWGCGCYTNADFTATGTGGFELKAMGDTSTTTAMAPGMTGANSFDFIATWLDSTFTIPDYSTTAQ